MSELDLIPLAIWSLITVAVFAITGFVYRKYLRRKHNATPSS